MAGLARAVGRRDRPTAGGLVRTSSGGVLTGVPPDVVGDAIARTSVDEFVAAYERSRT